MASDNLVMWIVAMFVEWYFLVKTKTGKDNFGREMKYINVGRQNIGLFFIFITAAVGIAVISDGESALAFVMGGIIMVISLMKFVDNVGE